jgi:hypothetical protein
MQALPIIAAPNQTFRATLGGQYCTINLRTLGGNLFADVLVNSAPIILNRLCLNQTRIVREAYLGFMGDFVFVDTQGSDDPVYTGLGTRFLLIYLAASDL